MNNKWDEFSKCLERTIEAVLDCKRSAVESVLLAEEAQRLAKQATLEVSKAKRTEPIKYEDILVFKRLI